MPAEDYGRVAAGTALETGRSKQRRGSPFSPLVGNSIDLAARPREAAPSCMMSPIKRFMITIQAPSWEDFEDVELPRLPLVGETIETKYGTCLVTHTEASSGTAPYQGKIVCRIP